MEKIHGKLFCDFALEKHFVVLISAICMLIFRIRALILTIPPIDFCTLDQMAKNTKFKTHEKFPAIRYLSRKHFSPVVLCAQVKLSD